MLKKILYLIQNQKKLLAVNELLSDKRFAFGVCAVIFLFVFFGLNAVINFFSSLPTLFRGNGVIPVFRLDFRFFGLYVLFFIVSLIISAVVYYKLQISFQDLNVGQEGRARFATLREIQQAYMEISEKDKPFDGIGGLVMARYGEKLYIDNRINNSFILALTRGGKGQLEVIPSIDILSRAKEKSSMVISDIKNGELARASIPKLIERGYKVHIINLADSERSCRLNLLDYATKYYLLGKLSLSETMVRTIAYSMYYTPAVKDPFWVEAPCALFTAVALAHIIDNAEHSTEKINLISIALFIGRLEAIKDEKAKTTALDDFFRSRPEYDLARLLYFTIEFSPDRTRGSVLSIAYSKLTLFCDPELADILSTNSDFDLEQIGFEPNGKPTALFLQMPINSTKYYPIISMIFSQIYFVLTTRCLQEDTPACPIPVKFIGDEIFNGGAIERLDNVLSTCLSFRISFDLYAQSMTQVEKVYGEKDSKIILDNCSTKIFMMSDNESTCKLFSERLGTFTQKDVTRSGKRLSINKSLTESYKKRPLMAVQELQQLEEGELVIMQSSKRRNQKNARVQPLPIRTNGELQLKYAYEYLTEFDTSKAIPYDKVSFGTAKFDYNSMLYQSQSTTDWPIQDIAQKDILSSIISCLKSQGFDENDINHLMPYPLSQFRDWLEDSHNMGNLTQQAYKKITLLLDNL